MGGLIDREKGECAGDFRVSGDSSINHYCHVTGYAFRLVLSCAVPDARLIISTIDHRIYRYMRHHVHHIPRARLLTYPCLHPRPTQPALHHPMLRVRIVG
jgi:hypothetical protein